MCQKSFQSLHDLLIALHLSPEKVKVGAFMTLVIENFFSLMRTSSNPTPTVLEYSYRHGTAQLELLKKSLGSDFVYFTNKESYYPHAPISGSDTSISYLFPSKKKVATNRTSESKDVPKPELKRRLELVSYFCREYGKAARQQTVRDKTKFTCGTKPLSTWFFANHSDEYDGDVVESVPGEALSSEPFILYAKEQVVVLRPPSTSSDEFWLGRLTEDILVHRRNGNTVFISTRMSLRFLERADANDPYVYELASEVNSTNSPTTVIGAAEMEEEDGQFWILAEGQLEAIFVLMQGDGTHPDAEASDEEVLAASSSQAKAVAPTPESSYQESRVSRRTDSRLRPTATYLFEKPSKKTTSKGKGKRPRQ